LMDGEKKDTALAVCTGCDIGQCLNADKLENEAAEACQGLTCMKHRALCSEAGLAELNHLLQENGIRRLVIAACSPRAKSTEFDLEKMLVERVNLREQVAWVMEAGHEDTQMCAEDQVRMALAKLEVIDSPDPYIPDQPSSEILVVGAGIAGITSALEGARAGYRVHLVERSDRPGGYAGRIYKALPDATQITGLQDPDIEDLIAELEQNKGVTIYLNSTVESISGEPGDFTVSLKSDKRKQLRVGAVVASTGWKPYNSDKLSSLGYGSRLVLTLEEFEEYVPDGKVPDRVMFILCAGSRDEKHLAYCSSYCCSAALKQALYVREKNPDSMVYIVYKDIRTTGFQEEFYKMVQADDAIFMTRGLVESVYKRGDEVAVELSESLLDDRLTLTSDMVVLATGMVPNSTADLQLQYRLGKGMPELEYDFSDSHFICFPYETRRTGIFAAGTVRAPMDMDGSREDGAGAMMMAIQCVESVKRGESVFPRSGDLSWPELYMDRCTDCKRCTEECPFGSYDETEKGTPLPNPARCRRCGICLGSCPERVIGFADFNINSVSAMIKAVEVPDEFEEKPRVLAFVCENDAYPALDAAGVKRLQISPFVRIIPVRCLGSINKVWISDALSHGYDGILQIGCKPGENYQCHFIYGSELTEQRGENLQETLETMMLEPERIQTRFVEITEHHQIQEIINDYVEELELIGPNPFKSM
jgi:quinone-modifying oxidoreductase subunit QmoB